MSKKSNKPYSLTKPLLLLTQNNFRADALLFSMIIKGIF